MRSGAGNAQAFPASLCVKGRRGLGGVRFEWAQGCDQAEMASFRYSQDCLMRFYGRSLIVFRSLPDKWTVIILGSETHTLQFFQEFQ